MSQYVTRSESDTAEWGAALGAFLRPGDAVLLRGEIGAGKSALARGIARALEVSGSMASPTFTLLQCHEGKFPVYHFDLYRLEDEEAFYAAGLDEFLDSGGVCLMEWPLPGILPASRAEVRMERGEGEDCRRIRLTLDAFARAEDVRGALKRWEETK